VPKSGEGKSPANMGNYSLELWEKLPALVMLDCRENFPYLLLNISSAVGGMNGSAGEAFVQREPVSSKGTYGLGSQIPQCRSPLPSK
jgi:hypothetical protein